MTTFYARLGGPLGWLQFLADGWCFNSWIVEPMLGHHGTYAVLMLKDV